MELSTNVGRAVAAVRWTKDMLAAFVHSPGAFHSSSQEPPAMRASGPALVDSFSVQAPETGTIAAATDRLASDFAKVVSTDAAPDAAVDATMAPWRAVDLDVSAVIGQRGTAAVLRRAVVLTRRTHTWMPEPSDDADFDACVRATSDALACQPPEARAAGQQVLEAAFHDLLASLVGAALTAQLLRAAWSERRSRTETVS